MESIEIFFSKGSLEVEHFLSSKKRPVNVIIWLLSSFTYVLAQSDPTKQRPFDFETKHKLPNLFTTFLYGRKKA